MLSVTLRLFFGLTLLTGVVYPLFVLLVAQTLMHSAANGSFLSNKERVVGSKYIGQQFTDKKYFWSRPSSVNYLPMPSGGSNLSLTNHTLKDQIEERAKKILSEHPGRDFKDIPSDMLYTSGSGIDPHISLKAAIFQFSRVVQARNLSESEKDKVVDLILSQSKWDIDRFLVDRYVNVLELNMALDEMK